MKRSALMVFLLLLCSMTVIAQNGFGRFYTTPGQRDHLDALREKKPQENIVVRISDTDIPDNTATTEETIPVDSITVDGLVYRNDGKNTAWINRQSTNSGSLDNQFTRVEEDKISPDEVEVSLPGNGKDIRLKVGQSYDAMSGQIHDIAEDNENSGSDGILLPPPGP